MTLTAKQKLVQRFTDLTDADTASELNELLDACLSSHFSTAKPGQDMDEAELNARIHHEIADVADYISRTRHDLASLRADEIKSEFLPTATDELSAIVGATEQATDLILSAMERLEELAETLPEDKAEALTDSVTSVYEACSFQDITGQRITRAVNALRHVENKVDTLLGYFGTLELDEQSRAKAAPTPKRADGVERPDEDLLNGPQMPGQGVSQDDIDALFD
ncbi:protein phosphatase CheZ [Kiloniella sp. b19]|uniref:protein phosphatase CheZ n=1 Tax=Kiloniella sp. GXU_MW_B19 TaxID=3141326 RepID=UPI0031DF067D